MVLRLRFFTDADDLVDYFNATILCNGASTFDVDALTVADCVTLKATDGVCGSGILYARHAVHRRHGQVSVTSEYVAGTTAIASVETSACCFWIGVTGLR